MRSRAIKILVFIFFPLAAALAFYPMLKQKLLADKNFLELTQASVWADLQGLEYTHRSLPGLKMPMLLEGAINSSKYNVLGVRGLSERTPYVWIVLNDNAGANGVYAMPSNVNFHLSCIYLKELESREDIDSVADQFLKRRCID